MVVFLSGFVVLVLGLLGGCAEAATHWGLGWDEKGLNF